MKVRKNKIQAVALSLIVGGALLSTSTTPVYAKASTSIVASKGSEGIFNRNDTVAAAAVAGAAAGAALSGCPASALVGGAVGALAAYFGFSAPTHGPETSKVLTRALD